MSLPTREEGEFVIKELDHTTAEQLEASVDEVIAARGADDLGVPFNSLSARLNYIEEKLTALTPNVVAISFENYARLPSSLRKKKILYVIVKDVTEPMGISISEALTPEEVSEIESYGGVFANGGI